MKEYTIVVDNKYILLNKHVAASPQQAAQKLKRDYPNLSFEAIAYNKKMTDYKYKTFIIYEQEYPKEKAIADGVILPTKQVALVWRGENSTSVVFPDIELLLNIQNKMPNRKVHFGGFSPDGILLNTFTLVRTEDVTGVSGNGIVAYGCDFGSDSGAVMQWAGEQAIPSIAFYPKGIIQINTIHGHDGKTKVEFDYPNPSW